MTEAKIIRRLFSYFQNGYLWQINNAYIFKYNWESDFFCQSRSGYLIEVEVKVSVSDFNADFKKEKHKYLSGQDNSKKFIPNKFYYAVPEEISSKIQVPEYAGLIVISNFKTDFVKKAPLIHKNKIDVRPKMCEKFYHKWLNEKRSFALYRRDKGEYELL